MFTQLLLFLALLLLMHITLPLLSLALSVGPGFLEAAGRVEVTSALLLSIQTASLSVLIAALTGIPLAYLIARSNSKIARITRIIIMMPLTIPPLIAGALLLNVYGKRSFIGLVGQSLGLSFTQSPIGIILAQLYVSSPFVVLASAAAFEQVDKNYEYTSRLLGKGAAETFIKVSLPLASRGIAAGLLLGWVRAMGEFGATVMMAYNPKTISIQLWEDNAIGGLSLVMPSVALVLLVSFTLLIFLAMLIKRGSAEVG